ncbi:MAG: metallophosphoesterase [Chlamydiota bacterium]
MTIWAISDLHLSFGTPHKDMAVFGNHWNEHHKKIKSSWKRHVSNEDLVLIPGDISWAMRLEGAQPDFAWLDNLPGTKLILRGNHDYWWSSPTKVRKALPPSLHIIHNDAFDWEDVTVGGARLWDSNEYSFEDYIDIREGTTLPEQASPEHQNKIFQREILRLEQSLKALNPKAKTRIVMTHYPPIGADLHSSIASKLLEKYHIDICLFGHLHSLKKEMPMFGKRQGIEYKLVSCDYLNFTLQRVL